MNPMLLAIPLVPKYTPAEPVAQANAIDNIVLALMDLRPDPELLYQSPGMRVLGRTIQTNPPKPKPALLLITQRPRDRSGTGLARIPIPDRISTDPVPRLARRAISPNIMNARPTQEPAALFAEDASAHIGEGDRIGHREHLLTYILGCGFDGSVIVLAPRHPWEQVPVAGIVDRIKQCLGVIERVVANQKPL